MGSRNFAYRWCFRWLSLAIIATISLGWNHNPVFGQAPSRLPDPPWQEITDLTAGLDATGFRPSFAADPAGRLYVVWPGYAPAEDAKSPFDANSVFYATWDGGHWSQPVDVIFDEGGVGNPIIYVDDAWRIHVYWIGHRSINHSWTWIDGAQTAGRWHTAPVAYGGNFALVEEKGGRVHLVYAEDSVKLSYQRSDDEGVTWTDPQRIEVVGDSGKVAINVISVAVDHEDRIHVAWNINTRERGWSPDSVWYVHSLDHQGETWSSPILIDSDPQAKLSAAVFVATEPQLAVDPSGTLHLFWHRGVAYRDGRFHIWSTDGGESWSEKRPTFPGYRGSTGNDSIVFDSTGTMHLLMSAAPADGRSRMYHSMWRNGSWSPLEFIAFAEHPSAVITHGNLLHLVMWWGGGIGYTQRPLDAPYVQPVPVPTFVPPTLTPSPSPSSPIPTVMATATLPAPVQLSSVPASPSRSSHFVNPVLAGSLSAFVLVCGFLLVQTRRRQRE